MITESILNVFFGLVNLLLGILPDVSWTVKADMFTKFFEIIRVVCYFLPMGTVVAILLLIVSINVFKIFIALLRAIIELIPFM